MKNMLQKNLPPSHPGEILREMFIKEHKLTVTEVAAGLRVSRVNLFPLLSMNVPALVRNWPSSFLKHSVIQLSFGSISRKTMNYGMRKRK
jgi:hypothetical protein